MARGRRLAFKVALAVFLAGLGYVTVDRAALRPVKLVDFTVYMAAGQSVLSGGQDLYQVTDDRGLHYTYPPPFAVFFAPIALLPPVAAATLWYVITIALLIVGLRATLVAATPAGRPFDAALVGLPLLLCADPVLGTITRGQLSILMFACSAVALDWQMRGRSFQSGLLVGFTTVLKVYSGLLILYFIVRREWRALGGVIVGGVITALIPVLALGPRLTASHWVYWLTRIALPSSGPPDPSDPLFNDLTNLDFAKNASILASLTHITAFWPALSALNEQGWVRLMAQLISVGLVAALFFVWRRQAGHSGHFRVIFEWSLAAMVGIVILPIAWVHYFCMLIIPLTAIAGYLRYEPAGPEARLLRRVTVAAGVLAGLFMLTSALRGPLDRTALHDALMMARAFGAYCWATLLLCGALLYLLYRKDSFEANLSRRSGSPPAPGGTRHQTLPR